MDALPFVRSSNGDKITAFAIRCRPPHNHADTKRLAPLRTNYGHAIEFYDDALYLTPSQDRAIMILDLWLLDGRFRDTHPCQPPHFKRSAKQMRVTSDSRTLAVDYWEIYLTPVRRNVLSSPYRADRPLRRRRGLSPHRLADG